AGEVGPVRGGDGGAAGDARQEGVVDGVTLDAALVADGDAPALVVGEVQVQDVELVLGHLVDHLLDLVDRVERAGGVEHEAAPLVAGRVGDLDSGDGPVDGDGLGRVRPGAQQLQQGLDAVEQSGLGPGGDGYPFCGGRELVAL